MVTNQQISGSWREIVGGIKSRWGEITDDELTQVEGNVEQLVGLIQRKTGETRQRVEQVLEELSQGGTHGVADSARKLADQTRERVQHASEQVTHQVQEGYAQAEQTVRRHPLESVAVAFGVGIVSGLVVGLMIRPR